MSKAKTEWTDAQRAAIQARGSNILVSAAAGSGKTAVLVERVIQLICDDASDVDIDSLLIVTFTNAAAAEMRSRIAARLEEMIAEEPNNTRLLRQRALLPNARISTIDSFCINFVREYFFRLNIAQDFTILEETQKAIIEQDVIETLVEELYEKDDEEFRALVELLSTTENDDDLIESVKTLDNYITAQAFPFEWLNEICKLYHPESDINGSELKTYAVSEMEKAVRYVLEVIDFTRSSIYSADPMCEKYTAMLNADEAVYRELLKVIGAPWNEIRKALDARSFVNTPRVGKDGSESKEMVLDNRKLYKGKDSFFDTEILPLFAVSEEEFREDNAMLYPILLQLTKLVEAFHRGCMEVKREMNSYSFSDIAHFAIDLLFDRDADGNPVPSEIAKEYQESFSEILVDEYQDTNESQDKLFEVISNGLNRFMVGDVKQSIYRFRLAMPRIFNQKKEDFADYTENGNEPSKKIILEQNFRSNEDICSFTNYIFSHLMTRNVGEMDYTPAEYLNCGAKNNKAPAPAVQLNVLDVPKACEKNEFEARHVARCILERVRNHEQVREKDGTRDITFGDIAVLLRSTKSRIDTFARVFTEYGIPVVANNRMNLFENNEVAVLVSLLRTIDNPTQDIPLLATLMSVFYGYSADSIASARVKHKANNLYSSVSQEPEVFSAFLEDLEKYRKYAASMSVESLIRQIISDTSYLSLISAMGNDEQRKLNVMKLLTLARSFDSGENVGLTVFIRFVDSMKENDVNFESADAEGVSENCVHLMSVHKSKGLEFPVVILAGAANQYNTKDLSSLFLRNEQFGVGLKGNNEDKLYRYNSVQYSCIQSMNAYALMSENLRVLYVAITRAKDQFIAFAAYKDSKSSASSKVNSLSKKLLGNKVPEPVVKNAKSDAELLILCLLLHPDAEVLRAMCDRSVSYYPSSAFPLSVTFSDKEAEIEEKQETPEEADEETVRAIEEKLSFTYANGSLSGYAAKRTASSLDDTEQSYRFFATKVPSFISGGKLSGSARGTATHTFMQYCRFEEAKADLEAEIKRVQSEGFLSEEQASALNRKKLEAFFSSDLCDRMLNADALYREYKVSSFVPLCELEDNDSTEPVLIIGVVDCVFEEAGKLVLVDYKTDKVKTGEELLSLYQKQLAFYRRALEKTFGKEVKEAMLYSFSLEKCCIYK